MSQALDQAQARFAERAPVVVNDMIEAEAAGFLRRPRKLAEVALCRSFPPTDDAPFDMLNKVGSRLAALQKSGRDGHWTYNFNWHVANLGAELALLRIVGAER